MIKQTFVGLTILSVLSACGGPSMTPEQKAQAAKNKAASNAVWNTRKPVAFDGKTIEVAINPERNRAYVGLAGFQGKASIVQFEQVASKASGCVGKDTSILSMLTGDRNTPIPLDNIKMEYLAISITC
ncbi:hypothetical protein BFP76_03110 [Amylibacter kogurei]|uniref:Lipoprotein n=1 Tax=Paramylibacter kogurei TaxID=1889778 RepID=A0A2G5K540_9RHOB|nr:hypothetical protein [Amylibacter kogurei]PIB24229.1 hypothetical protein BFP76_03110 [Amylibacter kogurei]